MKKLMSVLVVMLLCSVAMAGGDKFDVRIPRCPDPCKECPTPPACICNPAPCECNPAPSVLVPGECPPPEDDTYIVPPPAPVIRPADAKPPQPQGKWIGAASVAYLDKWIFGAGSGYRFPSGVALIGQAIYSDDDADDPYKFRCGCKTVACPQEDRKDWGGQVTVTWGW